MLVLLRQMSVVTRDHADVAMSGKDGHRDRVQPVHERLGNEGVAKRIQVETDSILLRHFIHLAAALNNF